jgi:hypothetical protein
LTLPGQEVAAAPSENGEKGGRRERGGRGGRDRGRGRDRGERTERTESAERPRREEQLSIEASNGDAKESVAPAAAPRPAAKPQATPTPAAPAATAPSTPAAAAPSALYRRVSRRGPVPSGPPPLLEGQTVGPSAAAKASAAVPEPVKAAVEHEPEAGDHGEMIKRLTALKGVGQKTAEAAVAAFGPGVLDVVRNDPKRVLNELGARRAQPLIDAAAEKKKAARPVRASSPRKAGGAKKAGPTKRARPKKSATKK